jgi:hypothetical protein
MHDDGLPHSRPIDFRLSPLRQRSHSSALWAADWPGAIARNRAALLRIVAVLFVYAGLDEGGADECRAGSGG